MNRYGALTPRDFKSLASAYSATSANMILIMEAPSRFELEMKVLQTSALPLGYGAINNNGAGDEIRTRDVHLGKVTLYH